MHRAGIDATLRDTVAFSSRIMLGANKQNPIEFHHENREE